jgi:hypothetical protein
MKKTKLLLSSLILFWGIMFSCKIDLENLEELPASNENSILLKRARISFEERLKNDPLFKKYKVEPFWDKAIYFGNTIEVAFTINGEHHRPRLKENPEIIGREKLVLVESGKKFNAILVRYIPSKEFKGKIGDINTQNIAESKFDGVVSMNVLGEETNTILYVSNGKVIKKIHVKPIEVYKKGRVAECTTYYEQDVVVRYDSRGEWYFEYVFREWTVCTTNGDPGGLNNGGGGGNPCDYIPALCNGGNGNGNGGGNSNGLPNKETEITIKPKCAGLNDAWNYSFNPDGSAYKETHGFIYLDSNGNPMVVILPQSGNTVSETHWGSNDGGVEYGSANGVPKLRLPGDSHLYTIIGTFHTHPNNDGWNQGPSQGDLNNPTINHNFLNDVPEFIFATQSSYSVDYSTSPPTVFSSLLRFGIIGCN